MKHQQSRTQQNSINTILSPTVDTRMVQTCTGGQQQILLNPKLQMAQNKFNDYTEDSSYFQKSSRASVINQLVTIRQIEQYQYISSKQNQSPLKHSYQPSQRESNQLVTQFFKQKQQPKQQISAFLLKHKNEIGKLYEDNQVQKERISPQQSFHEQRKSPMKYEEELTMNNLKLEHILEIGRGAYGVVKLGRNKNTNQKYAIKIYEKNKLTDQNKINNVQREISILKKIDHHNIIKLYTSIEDKKSINLVMEYISSISLHNYVKTKQNKQLGEQEALKLFSQLADAIHYLHSLNIAHRDIKLDNILLMGNNYIKMIDFGFAITADKRLNTFCGTPSYMSPEMVSKVIVKFIIKQKQIPHYPSSSDIWAIGIVFYTILFGEHPFKACTEKELFKKIQIGNWKVPDHIKINALSQKILKGCLEKPIERRWNSTKLNQVLQSEFCY